MTFRNVALGILFFLFAACFLAIVVEELFFGGKRRKLAAQARVAQKHEQEGK